MFVRLLCCSVLAIAAFTQEFRATLSGHVYDASGSAVPEAKVQAVNKATNETSNATTDSSGSYSIPFLRPGDYRLTITAQGFKQYIRETLTLAVGQIAGVDINLEIGAVSESVNVVGETAILETQTASRVGVVNSLQVTELPLNARNPFMLGTMMSGVTFRGAAIWQRPFDNGAIAEWSVNGGRQSNNEFLMDGAPNNAQAGGNNIAYVPIVDAVQEFSVQQNSYDAQYGKTGGGVFNVVLKSGGNDFHATGWEFLRRKFLDANTYQGNAVGAQRPNHSLDQYGGQVSGPVYLPKILKKDSPVKLFYLGSFENYREQWPQFLRNSYAEPEMRTGDFSRLRNAQGQPVTIYDPSTTNFDAQGNPVRSPFPGNRIPENRINPVARNVTQFMPTPNFSTPGEAYSRINFLTPEYAAKDKFYNLILKFDWNFGDNHRAFVRHASNDRTEDRAVNGIDNGVATDGQQPFQRINDAYVIDWLSTISPTLVVNVRASYNRFIEKGFGRANEGFDLTSLGLPSSLVSQLPSPAYFGRWNFYNAPTGDTNHYSPLGRYQGINITNNYVLAGNVTKISGSHTMKFGIDVRRIHYIRQDSGDILRFTFRPSWTQRLWNQAEPTSGDPFASFLLGLPDTQSNNPSQVNFPVYPFFRLWYVAPYFQDDWKVSRRLTLNLGLRWDYNGAPSEKYNRFNRGFNPFASTPIANRIPEAMLNMYPHLRNLKGGLEFAGVNGNPVTVSRSIFSNWQPRVGAAFQLTNRLVVRGGYGVYNLNPNNDYYRYAGFEQQTALVNSLDGGRTPIPNLLSNPFPSGVQPPSGASLGPLTFLGRDTNWFNPNFHTPYNHQFSAEFQYQVTNASTISFAYVGSRTVDANNERRFNLPSAEFRKLCNPQEGGVAQYCEDQVPNPFQSVAGFEGTPFYTNSTLSRFQVNRAFPQFNGHMLEQGVNGSSIWYNSLQINYNYRASRNLTLLTNYTWGKMMERFGFNDPYRNIPQQGLYFNDRTHIFKATAVYQLPFGPGQRFGAGQRGVIGKLIGGWEFTTYYNNSSGEPNNLPGNPIQPNSGGESTPNVIQLKDPSTPGGGWDGTINWKAHQVRGWNPCVLRQNNDGSIVPQQYSLNLGCGTDHSNYAWLMLPTNDAYIPRYTPYRSGQVRKHHAFTMDASLNKMTNITERLRVQFRIEAFNVMNHYFYGRNNGFNVNPNDPNFGTIFPHQASDQNGTPRYIQLGIKVYW